MATLTGEYENDQATEPKRIDLSGSREEILEARPGVVPGYDDAYAHGPTHIWRMGDTVPTVDDPNWHLSLPPKREAVHKVARRVEIQCDDQRLIDWMKAGEP